MKGVVTGVYFNTKEPDKDGNFIQPVVVIEHEGERKRVFFPKSKTEEATCKKGDLVEISNIVESSGFLRAEFNNIKVLGQDRRKVPVKNNDDKQMSIWKGQAFNCAYSRAVEDNLFDEPDKEKFKKELFNNAQEALELIQEWQNG